MKREDSYIWDRTEKMKSWGDGAWLDEPDIVRFEHRGLKCEVRRMGAREDNGSLFGGHLCGYVLVPQEHPYCGKDYDDIPVEVHGGLTWSAFDLDGSYWVGFDCAHGGDLIPSMADVMIGLAERPFVDNEAANESWNKLQALLAESGQAIMAILKPTYKSMEYAIGETESLAYQIFQLSSAVEQGAVNAEVAGSSPAAGD